jgi:hypothetical protein
VTAAQAGATIHIRSVIGIPLAPAKARFVVTQKYQYEAKSHASNVASE